jgi:hypothetical protein
MPVLYDLLTTDHEVFYMDSPGESVHVNGVPANLPVFDCSDVVSFICETLPEWDYFNLCLAPPFPDMFIEYAMPSGIPNPHSHIGARIIAENIANVHAENPEIISTLIEKGAKWVIKAHYFAYMRDDNIGEMVGSGLCLQACLDNHGLPIVGLSSIFRNGRDDDEWLQELDQEVADNCVTELFPALFSISYLSDRHNLQPEQPTRQQRRHAARTGQPEPYTYHVVKVGAFAEFRHRESKVSGSGSTPRLHDVRAHWVHYTPEKPLFGKVVGMVWRTSHLRGNPERGVVEKSYEVVPPKKKTA